MWPTESTPYLLLVGAIPPLFAIIRGAQGGLRGLLSLRVVGVVSLWLGYHLTPILAYRTGTFWNSFLLVPDYVDSGLLFSSLCMFAFLIGYGRVPTLSSRSRNADLSRLLPEVKLHWLYILAVISLVFFLLSVGGVSEAWATTYGRVGRRYDTATLTDRLRQVILVVSLVPHTAFAVVTSVFILRGRSVFQRLVLATPLLLEASLFALHGFSRGSGFAFLLLAYLALTVKGQRGIVLGLVSLTIGIFLGWIGLYMRGSYSPGVGTFVSAAVSGRQAVAGQEGPLENPLDAITAWTRMASLSPVESSPGLESVARFLWNLQPLPSELVGLKPTGEDLADVMHSSVSGITTPALAEIYHVFSWYGCILFIGLGCCYSWFEKLRLKTQSLPSLVCVALVLASFSIGLHSTTRAMTRPLVYAFVLNYAFSRRLAARKKAGGDREPTTRYRGSADGVVPNYASGRVP